MTDTQLSPDLAQADAEADPRSDDVFDGDAEMMTSAATDAAGDPALDAEAADDDVRRFRAETYEDALAQARGELGPGVRVVEANRIRRGGLGGFFATDLGIEIAVVATDGSGVVNAVADARTGNPIEDATAGGALLGQSLGMTDERLLDLLRRAEQRDRTENATFADHLERAASQGDGATATTPTADAGWRDIPAGGSDRTVEDERFVPRLPPRSPVATTPAAAVEPIAPIEPPRLPARGPIGAVVRTAPPGFVEGCEVLGDPVTLPDVASSTTAAAASTVAPARSIAPVGDVPADGIVNARPPLAVVEPTGDSPTTTAPPPEDVLARPTRLAAAATDRLMSKLGKLQVADGSKLGDLSRLRVSVTTADGNQIEMTADLATGRAEAD